jgi:predicted nucleic acid-binding protein
MSEEFVLLDTSVWIHYLRPEGREELKAAVKKALTEGRVFSCWVVRAEILVGSRDKKSFEKLLEHLGAVPDVPIDEEIWKEAARLGHTLRKAGLTIPLPDLLITQTALVKDLMLWHADSHFEEIRRFASLRTRSFLSR